MSGKAPPRGPRALLVPLAQAGGSGLASGSSTGTGTGGEVLLLDCSRVASFARKGRI